MFLDPTPASPGARSPSVAEVRAWARDQDQHVPERGRLRADLWTAWHSAHPA
ncbi:Lsr2 family DNA-binding protein [Streptacidiphilus sp. PAMC 29251]